MGSSEATGRVARQRPASPALGAYADLQMAEDPTRVDPGPPPAVGSSGPRRPVPVRTILATIGLVIATLGTIWMLQHVTRILTWVLVAVFFTVVLSPPVDFAVRRLHLRRGLAVGLVFITGLGLLVAMLYAFIRPIVDQSTEFADNFPQYVAEAKAGKGTVGKIVKKYKIDDWFEKNKKRLQDGVKSLGKSGVDVAKKVFNTVAATLTIAVLTILMLMEGPEMLAGIVRMLSPPHRERAIRIGHECSRAISGYVAGNLAISVIAGAFTYVFLWIAGVPFRGVLALWVGFADLIPLVGATLGALATIGVAFLHSVPAGIAVTIFYVIYQQFENQVLQVTIMSRTVSLSPLAVLVSVLFGVELFGLLGALLAIPIAAIGKVLAAEVLRFRRPDLIVVTPTQDQRRGSLRRRRGRAQTLAAVVAVEGVGPAEGVEGVGPAEGVSGVGPAEGVSGVGPAEGVGAVEG